MKSLAEIGVPSSQTASLRILNTSVIGSLLVSFGSSENRSGFQRTDESGSVMNGTGSRPVMTCAVSNVEPSVSNTFQLGSFFSIATVNVPPCLVGPLLQVLGFVSQSAKPGEY